jgi:regulator of replication initiation timing
MRFVAEQIHALNHRIRGIINVLNRPRHDNDTRNDDLTGKIAGDANSAGVGNANLIQIDEGLEDQANIHELENNLKMANEELKLLRKNSKSLAEENGQMKIDMNRAVIELEQLLNQLGQLKSQVTELKCENKTLACEKELHDLENKPHVYLNDGQSERDDYSKEGSLSEEDQIRNSYCGLEEETSNIGSSLADALQKYKIGPEAGDEPNTQSAGDSSGDVNSSKKLPLVGGAFGLFGRRNKGAGQTTGETNHNAEESPHQIEENCSTSRGKGVLGGLFNRGDSGRGSPGPVGDAAASPQNPPVPQRKGLFRGMRSERSIILSSTDLGGDGDTSEVRDPNDDNSTPRKSFRVFRRRSSEDRKGAAAVGRDGTGTLL